MHASEKSPSSGPPRSAFKHPGWLLGFGTASIALLAVLASFTSAYAQLVCSNGGQNGSDKACFVTLPTAQFAPFCEGGKCHPDDKGNYCPVQGFTSRKIYFVTFAGPGASNWSKCTSAGNMSGLSCSETATSCGTPTFYMSAAGGSGSGSGASQCDDTSLVCDTSNFVWKVCGASNNASPCKSQTGSPVPGQP